MKSTLEHAGQVVTAMSRLVLGVGLAGAAACGTPPEAGPPIEPAASVASTGPSIASLPPSPTAVAVPKSVVAPPTSEPPPPAELPRSIEAPFAPIDTKCARDSDCAVTQHGVSERLFCCDGCDAVAGEKAWVARANAACKAYEAGASKHPCPPRDCTPPGPARCHQGRCELVPTRP